MREKNYSIELLRFIGIMAIAFFHVYAIGIPYGSYRFANGWMFTDMFFSITGYYTVLHFEKSVESIKAEDILVYIFKKIRRFMPYIIPSVAVVYAIDLIEKYYIGGINKSLEQLLNLPLELTLITSAFKYNIIDGVPTLPLNAPLWFLSAMFVVMPMFCLCVSRNEKGYFWIISFFFLIIDIGFSRSRSYTIDLMRAFLGLFSGMAIYFLVTKVIRRDIVSEWGGYIGSAILFATLALMFFNMGSSTTISLLTLATLLFFLSSDKCIIPRCLYGFIDFLGKISTPLYIWHWPIAKIVKYYVPEALGRNARMMIYIFFALFVAIVSFFVVDYLRKTREHKKVI